MYYRRRINSKLLGITAHIRLMGNNIGCPRAIANILTYLDEILFKKSSTHSLYNIFRGVRPCVSVIFLIHQQYETRCDK